jgi:hypothetical protein
MEKNQNPAPPIPLKEAIQQAKYWRDYCQKLLGEKDLPVIKAFFIPLADLLHVTELAKSDSKHDVAGLRLYFRLENKDDDLSALKAMIVPVVYGTPDIAQEPLMDWLQIQQPGDLEGDSLVYDFTKPCPTECDNESLLVQ